ncbi:glycoprotein [Ascoidea rubescens DSM 1968]|uniref:Glyco protein n=1 Tax=Ascoidea rubescens DSM 1968 TaxID=1344418 RepID=A0A1D2VEK4_9ASCO|nr:glyco protein [Ascoidea rubescens DSM 1968]ODV59897.1 glyco protein [Ascoidea rubescens DSM 1968]
MKNIINSLNILIINVFIVIFFNKFVSSDVSISKPLSGQTFSVSGDEIIIDVKWVDSGAEPKIEEIVSYTFTLCTGSNSDITAVDVLGSNILASKITNNYFEAKIDPTAGENGVYYIQIFSVYPTGYSIHYSHRFKLSGMTGKDEASGSLNDPPPSAQYSFKKTGTETETDEAPGTIDSASFTIPYTLQTGRTRYAPMQTQPGSKVTATGWTRRFPTSAVTFYKTAKPSPVVYSTITPGWSYSRTSYFNYATPAPYPSDNGGWYGASERLIAPVKMNPISLRRRWLNDFDDDYE